jgi:hypothetical protein
VPEFTKTASPIKVGANAPSHPSTAPLFSRYVPDKPPRFGATINDRQADLNPGITSYVNGTEVRSSVDFD